MTLKDYLTFICSRAYMISLGYAVVVLTNLALLGAGFFYGPKAMAVSIAGVGLISFFGVIGLVNGSTGDGSLNNGEMRKAITASFITVYLAVMAKALITPVTVTVAAGTAAAGAAAAATVGTDKLFALQDDFTKLVGGIVLFYFGSSSFRDYLAAKAARPADPAINTAPAPDRDIPSSDSGSEQTESATNPKASLLQNIQIISPNPNAPTTVNAGDLSLTESNLVSSGPQQ